MHAGASPGAPGPRRDRLVLLGRKDSGKTTYLARLYHELSHSGGALHMIAVEGAAHVACAEIMDELAAGRWPEPTICGWFLKVDVSAAGRTQRLQVLDYPGDVFHRAFVEPQRSPETEELVTHLDRAALVIALIDPGVAGATGVTAHRGAVDDDFGMAQALARLRAAPGGDRVPVAVVFTKCDRHRDLIRAHGGLKQYLAQRYPNLLRRVGRFRVFGCAAVFARDDGSAQPAPDLGPKPVGIVEPLAYCLQAAQSDSPPATGPLAAPPVSPAAPGSPGSRAPTAPARWRIALRAAAGIGALALVAGGVGTRVFLRDWLPDRATRQAPPSSAASPRAQPQSPQELQAAQLYDLIQETVCRVVVRQHVRIGNRVARIPVALGTGFVVSADGLIATNRHVVDLDDDGPRNASVIGSDVVVLFRHGGRTMELAARDIQRGRTYDLAWFRVDHSFPEALEFAPTPVPGQQVKAFGFPGLVDAWSPIDDFSEARGRYQQIVDRLGTRSEPTPEEWIGGPANLVPSVTAGIISAIRDTEEGLLLQTDTFVHHGNSGGPLVDAAGRVLGIVTFGSDESGNTNFCLAGYAVWEEMRNTPGVAWPEGW